MPYSRYGRNNGREGGRSRETESYDDRGRIVLWESRSNHPKAPTLTGRYTDDDGREWAVSLWEVENQSERSPVLRGMIQPPQPRDEDVGGGRRRAPMQGKRSYGQRRELPLDEERGRIDPDLNDDPPF